MIYNKNMEKRYGIFGGAFNPPHKEHIRICEETAKVLGLDKIILVPSFNAPHKNTQVSFEDRCQMTFLSVKDNPVFLIDDIEKDLNGKTYSYLVLKALKEKYKNIVFIIGGDSLYNFHKWRNPDEILKTCPVAVISRGEDKNLSHIAEEYNKQGGEVKLLNIVGKDVSSSLIRYAIQLDVDIDEYLYPLCAKYIKEKGLYLDYQEMVNKLKENLSEERYQHTVQTVMTALHLNTFLGLSSEKVFISALLHDCAKNLDKIHQGVPEDCIHTPVLHAFNGAIEAEKNYGISDFEIIEAIRYHTTGRANMSTLEKLIFLADLIEPSRDYPGVEEIREVAYQDFEKGFLLAVKRSKKYLEERKVPIYYLTEECYNYYVKEN